MEFSADWRDDAENAVPEERATVADLLLSIDGGATTQHLHDGVVRDRVTVALYGLANGLAHDWWTIFGRRDGDVSFLKYRNGYLLPDLRLKFDGELFSIQARQWRSRDPDLRFWGAAPEVMTRGAAEQVLTDLVGHVLDRLASRGRPDTGAAQRWRRVQASRASEEAGFCEAAGGLGLDPYDIPGDVASFIEGAERLFTGEALVEFVSGSAGVRQAALLDWAEELMRSRGSANRLAGLRSAIDEVVEDEALRPGQAAWAVAYRRARCLKRRLGLGQDHRFSSFRDLARRLGATRDFALAPRVDGIRALRSEGQDGIRVHLRDQGESAGAFAGHLFALARAVGDATCFPDPGTAAINDLHDAYRQAASRAFAAEFLAPIDEIRSMLEDRHDVVTIAAEFSVSTAVIDRQIENRERIARSLDAV